MNPNYSGAAKNVRPYKIWCTRTFYGMKIWYTETFYRVLLSSPAKTSASSVHPSVSLTTSQGVKLTLFGLYTGHLGGRSF